MNFKFVWKRIRIPFFSILIALAVGGLSALLTKDSMERFSALNQPPLSPPNWLFPLVWSILYILMGISAARVYEASAPREEKRHALIIYAAQLVLNFFWSILFFNLARYFAAFVWLLALLAMVLAMILSFSPIDRLAAKLQIPYLIWVLFAGYLNLGVAILN